MSEHYLDDSVIHAFFDRSHPARIEIEPGDTVVFECRDPVDDQVPPDSGPDSLLHLDFGRIHPSPGRCSSKARNRATPSNWRFST